MERHSTILFGGYNWLVLDVQANAALMITKDIIEQHPYHNVYTYAILTVRNNSDTNLVGGFLPTEANAQGIPRGA